MCNLRVTWPTLRVSSAELVFVLRERPRAPAHARPCSLDVDVEVDDEHAAAFDQVARLDRAPAERDDDRITSCGHVGRDARLDLPERGLAAFTEEIRDRAVAALDLSVDVDERPAEPPRDFGAERRLPRAHEADEREMPV